MSGVRVVLLTVVMLTLGGCLGDADEAISPADPQGATLMETGVELYRRGNFRQAAGQFESALDRARLTADADRIFEAAYHAAATHIRLRQWDAARQMIRAAKAAADEAQGEVWIAPLRVLEGYTRRAASRPRAALRSVKAGLRANPQTPTRGLLHLLEAQAYMDLQDVPAAEEARTMAAQIWPDAEDEPGWSNLTGRLALLRGEPAEAAAAFEREAERAGERLDPATVAEAMAHAGAAYAQAGQWQRSGEAFLAAARSAQQQPTLEDRVGPWLIEARTAAQQAGDDELLERIERVR